MTPHDRIQDLLSRSAANLLDPEEERIVRNHLRECAECAARTEVLAGMAGSLRTLPFPAPPLYLAARTQAAVAAELAAAAERRRNTWLLTAAGAVSWGMAASSWYLYHLEPVAGLFGWVVLLAAPAVVAGPVTAALLAVRKRSERSLP